MVMRQNQSREPGEIRAGLRQAVDRATSGVDQHFFLAAAQ
jgi:hypothetical protein